MEAATLSSPQRNFEVVPVQKSLSLPSYARAGGEGIDHRVIFAALEQKEKIRRKSRIFAREKSSRQNIFCLPISSSAKCRETSLSSDTSCSSLEYQKPKSTPKPKKETKLSNNEISVNESSTAKTNQPEIKATPSCKNDVAEKANVEKEQEVQKDLLKTEDCNKDYRSPCNTLRPNVNSSDSMERSSRSSNDSLSRKERLVAIKAKVEAAREKYGESSSEEETRSSITRYNSDGVIHRTVKEAKSRSNRLEKRLRRRSQDEYALRKANRRNNLSLCLNSIEDEFKLDFSKPMNICEDGQLLECKTDFCPSPNFFDFTRKNYFSDFPSKENMTRIVQSRIKQIEEEERKRKKVTDFREKTKYSSRQSPQNIERTSPLSVQRRNVFYNQNSNSCADTEKNSVPDTVQCQSPISRSQAPTPPPRSPKSMTFVNKIYMKQHQNVTFNHDSHSLERKPFCPDVPISYAKLQDTTSYKIESTSSELKLECDDSAEKRKMKELLRSRRKTCSYFDYSEHYLYNTFDKTSPTSTSKNVYTPQNSPKSKETKICLFNSETPYGLSQDAKKRMLISKWEENEKRHEFMFNSLESKKKTILPSKVQWTENHQKKDPCQCCVNSERKTCVCNQKDHNAYNIRDAFVSKQPEKFHVYANITEVEAERSNRLSKSEVNIAYADQPKSPLKDLEFDNLCNGFKLNKDNSVTEKTEDADAEKLSATANLESAMEELESVYRSLKLTCDNLSDKNNEPNSPLNDLNAGSTKFDDLNYKIYSDSQSKFLLHLEDNSLDYYSNKPNYSKPISSNHIQCSKSFACSLPTNIASEMNKCNDSENICIDELFNDLTRQLDIEQKQLRESRESQTSNLHSDKCNKPNQKRMTPLESIVSIRKELYDNLQKNNREPTRASNFPSNKRNNDQEYSKRKYKAVQSLSENISYLMAAANSDQQTNGCTNKNEKPRYNIETTVIKKSSPKQYEHVVFEPLKIETQVSLNNPSIPKRSFVAEKIKNYGNEEIRQIRVSMDSNIVQSNSKSSKPLSNYPRLSSLVTRPTKNETSSRSSQSTNVSKEAVDVLDENGLENLLNTLLNDVPEAKQSSLMLSKEDNPATPPTTVTTSGEMRVLQHLDVLRLNPIPS